MEAKAAVVTGAAGGVGTAVVAKLVSTGFHVVAADVADSVHALDRPGSVLTMRADASNESDARETVRRAVETFGRLDLLVNNAGRFLKKPIVECTVDDWDAVMTLNARGPFLHSREAIPHLMATHGAVVNVASTAGIVALTNQSVYGASKGALIQLTRALAIECAPHIRVNAVAPGGIDTDFSRSANRDESPAERQARTVANYPLQRWSTAQEVAEAIVFLGSDAASAITGAVLGVDGGYTAR
jgi:NAD(P)-dependent dehydrogenase (short-subunit alcohol dehydrogenase family)